MLAPNANIDSLYGFGMIVILGLRFGEMHIYNASGKGKGKTDLSPNQHPRLSVPDATPAAPQ